MNIADYFTKKTTENYPACFDGERVIFDVVKITEDKDWGKLRDDYKEFILDNAEKVFTVEYDPNITLPARTMLVQLKEDTMIPKRLFWAGFLIPHKDDILKVKEMMAAKETDAEVEYRRKLEELRKYLGD